MFFRRDGSTKFTSMSASASFSGFSYLLLLLLLFLFTMEWLEAFKMESTTGAKPKLFQLEGFFLDYLCQTQGLGANITPKSDSWRDLAHVNWCFAPRGCIRWITTTLLVNASKAGEEKPPTT